MLYLPGSVSYQPSPRCRSSGLTGLLSFPSIHQAHISLRILEPAVPSAQNAFPQIPT